MSTAAVFNPFTPQAIRSVDSTLLKSLLDDPVQFREAPRPSIGGGIDVGGKGWIEVNPVGGGSKVGKKAVGGGSKDAHPHAREQPVASSSTLSPAKASKPVADKRVLYAKPIPLDFPTSQKQTIASGLHNTGNSCYANAVLQAIIHTPGFAHYVFDGDNHKPHSACPVNKAKRFDFHCQHCAIRAVLHNSFNLNKTAYTPTVITNNLKKIGKTLRKGRQEDAHEFLRFLVDGLQNVALFPFGDPNKLPAEVKYTTGIHQLFGGELRSRVTCRRCGHNSDTRDAFLDLSIEVRGCRTVQAGFGKFVKEDVLDGQNKYKCEKCNKLVVATKGLKISRAPQALVIQLRRFTPTGNKLNDVVDYPRELDIGPYMSTAPAAGGATYSLYAIVCHSGSGPHSGHYTSRVRSTDNKRWYRMDDSSVDGLGGKPPLGLREAYLLMYVRQKGGKLDEVVQHRPQQAKPQPSPSPVKLAPLQPSAPGASAANGNKKRRISQIPAEEDPSLPSPAPSSTGGGSGKGRAAESDDDNDDDDESDHGDDGEEDVGRPASGSLLRLNAPLVARKKARVISNGNSGGGLATPSASSSTSTASPPPLPPPSSSPAKLPQGLGPRPIGFVPQPSSPHRSSVAVDKKDKRRARKHAHKLPGHGGWKDPFGLSLAGKGGHKLKKGLVKGLRGRP